MVKSYLMHYYSLIYIHQNFKYFY